MLHRPMSRVLIAGSAFWALLSGTGPARADIFYETAYVPTSSVVLPTSSILSTSYVVPTAYTTTYLPTSSVYSVGEVLTTSATYVPTYRTVRYRPRRYVERTTYLAAPTYSLAPTSYVVPTSYLLPTSYVVPSSYVSTSYIAPTSYLLPTSYVVPSSYVSTSYIAPTSYLLDTSLVTTSASSVLCDTVTAAPVRKSAAQPSSGNGNTITSEPSSPGGSSNERRPSGTVDDGMPSNVTPPVPAPPSGSPKPSAGNRPGNMPEPGPIEAGTPPAPSPAPGGPGGDVPIPPPGQTGSAARGDETTLRSAQRPTTYDVRNILRGKVVSFDSGRPEEGVTVIVSSRTRNYTDRPAMTDADGEFKVSLPDGDWTVKVKMPSGSVYPVGRDYLTASNGKVFDTSGRNVKEFLISR
jgi:hypothetical protein